jgi:hypothetical protein
MEYLKRMAVKDFNTLREKAANAIEPGDRPSSSGSSTKK